MCRLHVVTLFIIQLTLQCEIAHPHNHIHRGANLVTHIGKKITLGSIGPLGLVSGPLQLLTTLFQFPGSDMDCLLQCGTVLCQLLITLLYLFQHGIEATGENIQLHHITRLRTFTVVLLLRDPLHHLGQTGDRIEYRLTEMYQIAFTNPQCNQCRDQCNHQLQQEIAVEHVESYIDQQYTDHPLLMYHLTANHKLSHPQCQCIRIVINQWIFLLQTAHGAVLGKHLPLGIIEPGTVGIPGITQALQQLGGGVTILEQQPWSNLICQNFGLGLLGLDLCHQTECKVGKDNHHNRNQQCHHQRRLVDLCESARQMSPITGFQCHH